MVMKLLKSIIPIILLTIFIAPAYGGDMSTPVLIGFSKDGRYVAFERYGIQDGSGYAYSDIYIVNVYKNSWASRPFRLSEDLVETHGTGDTAEAIIRKKNVQRAFTTLNRFGIIKGNKGRIVHRTKKSKEPWVL